MKAKTDEHRTATAWLGDRLQELGHDALAAEREVNELKTKSNIVSADGKFIDEQQVARLNNRLVDARTHTSDAMARLNRFESMLATADFDSDTLRILDAIPDRAMHSAPLLMHPKASHCHRRTTLKSSTPCASSISNTRG